MRFKVVMAGRDCFRFVSRSLESVAAQDDPAFDVCVIDDASTDPRQPEFMQEFCRRESWHFISNDTHRGALFNHVAAVTAMSPEPDDVIVSVDADDRLNGPNALSIVRAYYERYQPLLTYGSYRPDPDDWRVTPALDFPQNVILDNSYRAFSARDDGGKDPIWFNHLRTVKQDVFQLLEPAIDFTHPDGSWFLTCYDLAITIPALELAGGRHLKLPDVLYLYTRDNPRSDCYIHERLISRDKAQIFSLAPKQPLDDIVMPPRLDLVH
jgi:glycosyltransferase involved in cell wall biosynthesis